MANFCGNCGNEIKGNQKYCSQCGEQIERLQSQEELRKVKIKKKLLVFGFVGIFLVCGILLIKTINDKGYEDVAIQYAIALLTEDGANVQKHLPYDATLMGYYEDGDPVTDYEITSKIVQSYELSDLEIDQILENTKYEWGGSTTTLSDCIDRDGIGKSYCVEVELSVYEADEQEQWNPAVFQYIVAKYNGEWKVLGNPKEDQLDMGRVW